MFLSCMGRIVFNVKPIRYCWLIFFRLLPRSFFSRFSFSVHRFVSNVCNVVRPGWTAMYQFLCRFPVVVFFCSLSFVRWRVIKFLLLFKGSFYGQAVIFAIFECRFVMQEVDGCWLTRPSECYDCLFDGLFQFFCFLLLWLRG